jgi:tetratricopeptide (TPR) repeat protein
MGKGADWPALACGAVLASVAAAAYSRTFHVPLVYDDIPSIADNLTLRHLGDAVWPSAQSTVSGRPVLNLSLAVNYAISGTDVWSYHALNLAIHVMAALALFGIARRTLSRTNPRGAGPIAFSITLLWSLHPLLTESVTYVIQRAESLMGLFYLLTLYFFIRGAQAEGRGKVLWYAASVFSCLLGMGTKEVMVSAPLIVFLYDRTFLSGSFTGAWRLRRAVHASLAATWLVVPFLVISAHGRGGTVGFGAGVSWLSYAITQLPAIAHYLRLSFWPHPLVFDYGIALAAPSLRLVPPALLVAGLAVGTAWAVVRKSAIGFLGVCFFAILSPSSSFIPVVTETMAEHRMYLPLIPVVALFVLGAYRWLGRGALPLCLALGAGLCWATWVRNGVYLTDEGLWSDTVASRPGNERAQNNMGNLLAKHPGKLNEAIAHYREALRLEPGYADAHYNLGVTLGKIPGRTDEAMAEYEAALRLDPDTYKAHNNLGLALFSLGRTPEAITHYRDALRLRPNYTEAHYNLGNALSAQSLTPEAIGQYEEALRLNPDHIEAHYNLGNALIAAGRTQEAVTQYEAALRLRPDYADAHYNLGNALSSLGRKPEAIAHYEEALRLSPRFFEAHYYLGCDLEGIPGRLDDAITQYEEALLLRPDDAKVHLSLAVALLKAPGRAAEAVAHLREVLRLQPGNPVAGRILAQLNPPQF